jgi:hypothetical protein
MKKGISMSLAEAEAHQRKHGFLKSIPLEATKEVQPVKSKDDMNKTERDYSFILEARKRRGEIEEFRFQGMTLRWRDRETGELMRYTGDFTVWRKRTCDVWPVCSTCSTGLDIELHEVKGGWIKGKFERAVERFRHARTVHPMIHFEMHQKKGGSWQRIH